MARTTRSLRRHTRLLNQRIEALEQRVTQLEDELEYYAAKTRIRDKLPSPSAPSGSRFTRSEPSTPEQLSADAGARVVARHLLQSGREPDEVAAHLEEIFDLPDAASVVAEVAYYDSGLSEPTQEGT
jgi:hypothetical protein